MPPFAIVHTDHTLRNREKRITRYHYYGRFLTADVERGHNSKSDTRQISASTMQTYVRHGWLRILEHPYSLKLLEWILLTKDWKLSSFFNIYGFNFHFLEWDFTPKNLREYIHLRWSYTTFVTHRWCDRIFLALFCFMRASQKEKKDGKNNFAESKNLATYRYKNNSVGLLNISTKWFFSWRKQKLKHKSNIRGD